MGKEGKLAPGQSPGLFSVLVYFRNRAKIVEFRKCHPSRVDFRIWTFFGNRRKWHHAENAATAGSPCILGALGECGLASRRGDRSRLGAGGAGTDPHHSRDDASMARQGALQRAHALRHQRVHGGPTRRLGARWRLLRGSHRLPSLRGPVDSRAPRAPSPTSRCRSGRRAPPSGPCRDESGDREPARSPGTLHREPGQAIVRLTRSDPRDPRSSRAGRVRSQDRAWASNEAFTHQSFRGR